MNKERVLGLQSYAIRDVLSQADAAETARIAARVAAMGYRSMELRPEDFTPAPVEMKRILAEHGISVCAMNAEMTALDDEYEQVITRFRQLGCTQLVIPSRPRRETDIPRFVDKVAYYARKVNADGLHLQYHNHVAEFARLDDGTTMMARLLDLAAGGLFAIEVDVGWVQIAGLDPARFIETLPTDVGVVHLRDVAAAPDFANRSVTIPAGTGNLDWPGILAACRTRGVRDLVVEHSARGDSMAMAEVAATHMLPLL